MNMNTSEFKNTTQEGPRERESLHAPACSPQPYSGGDKIHTVPKNDDYGISKTDSDLANELVMAGASRREARVVLSRYEDVGLFKSPEDSDSSRQSLVTVGSSSPVGTLRRKRSRNQDRDSCDMSSDSGSDASAAKVGGFKKRGRGRPPTTGEYAGLAAAKAALVAVEREEMELRAEREVAELAQRCRPTRSTPSRVSESSADRGEELTAELCHRAMECVATVVSVAARSGNLKGTFQRALKDAATSLREIIGDLRERTTNDETTRLLAANNRLQAEVSDLRNQMSELQKEIAEGRAATTPAARTYPDKSSHAGSSPEELEQRLVRQVGDMINARLAAVEERLLPEKRARPPLATDLPEVELPRPPLGTPGRYSQPRTVSQIAERRRKILGLPPGAPLPPAMDPVLNPVPGALPDPIPTTSSEVMDVTQPTPPKAPKGKGKGKKVKSVKPSEETSSGQAAEPRRDASTLPRPHSSADAGWVEVAKKKKKKKKKTVTPASEAKKTPKKPRIRVPRTSAVVLTIQPEAAERGMSYAQALSDARARIDPTALGIQALAIRKAAAGGRLLELAGEGNGEQADSLANQLRAIFKPEDVRVTRPTKCVDMRVTGLDDSVTKEEVAQAIARMGECPSDSVGVKDIRRNAAGIGTCYVQCPAAAAKKVAKSERLRVGWVSARVKLLAPRPRRCFRCLEVGHVREQCQNKEDRSSICYRCGQPGHKACDCSAKPHCVLCAAASKPAEHRIGGKACPLPPKGKGRLQRK